MKQVQATTKRVVIYIRVSDQDQVIHGSSLEAQEQRCKDYAKTYQLQVVKILREEGVSAKDLKRPEMQRMLGMMEDGSADGVIVWKLDRLTRNLKDLNDLVDRFRKTGFRLFSVQEQIDTSGATGIFMLNILGSLAQFERQQIGDRVRFVFDNKRAKDAFLGGYIPAGLISVAKESDRFLECDPQWAKVVSPIWPMLRRGESQAAIASYLNKNAVPVMRGGACVRRKWGKTAVGKLLKNDYVVGLLVDQDEFDLVAQELASRDNPNRRTAAKKRLNAVDRAARKSPLNGLMTCAVCGRAISGVSGGYKKLASGGEKVHHYYRCGNAIGSRRNCTMPDLPAQELESAICRALVEAVREDKHLHGVLAAFSTRQDDVLAPARERHRQAKAHRQKLEQHRDAITDRLLAVDPSHVGTRKALETRVNEAQLAVDQAVIDEKVAEGSISTLIIGTSTVSSILAKVETGLDGLLYASDETRRALFVALLEEVKVSPDVRDVELVLRCPSPAMALALDEAMPAIRAAGDLGGKAATKHADQTPAVPPSTSTASVVRRIMGQQQPVDRRSPSSKPKALAPSAASDRRDGVPRNMGSARVSAPSGGPRSSGVFGDITGAAGSVEPHCRSHETKLPQHRLSAGAGSSRSGSWLPGRDSNPRPSD